MRFIKLIPLFAVIAFVAFSCSNDFDLTAEPLDIPIVYGILQVDEESHYIRVERAFLDDEIGPLILAQDPANLYYDDATVSVTNLDNGTTYQLERVTGEDEGITREPGVFATNPNILYKISGAEMGLEGGERIQLTINRGDDLTPSTAETVVLPKMSITRPISPIINTWNDQVKQKIGWKMNSTDAVIFDLEIVFNYRELLNNQPAVDKSITWRPVSNRIKTREEAGEIALTEEIAGSAFYEFIFEELKNDPQAIRVQNGIDIRVFAGGTEIRDFFTISLANAGITGSQDPPVFSNIEPNGRGIFSSKSVAELLGVTLQNSARDSLVRGRFTNMLGFQ